MFHVGTLQSKDLERIDLEHLWHPFTQYRLYSKFDCPLIVDSARGFELVDVDGKKYLDGVSSLWCNIHGHSDPELVEAIKSQCEKLCHSTLLGLAHVPILELTEELLKWTPSNLSRVFYADSGSTAVEASLRMAFEWWQKQNSPVARKKKRFASLVNAYHGDTLGALNVGFNELMHSSLKPLAVQSFTVPAPHVFRFFESMSAEDALEASLSVLNSLFDNHAHEIAAFIIEPLVQGAAGMWIHPAEYLRELASLCKKHDVFLIADEVATGFGKTGEMFAVNCAGVLPDLLVLGKGLSGGYLPISAVAATEQIFNGFVAPVEDFKTFFYGQTFAGNPLAAHVAKVNLELFRKRDLLGKIKSNVEYFSSLLSDSLSTLKHVDEVRSFGFMVGIELTQGVGERKPYPPEALACWKVVRRARELGVVIRPLGNVLVLMPAVAMGREELKRLVEVTVEAIELELG